MAPLGTPVYACTNTLCYQAMAGLPGSARVAEGRVSASGGGRHYRR